MRFPTALFRGSRGWLAGLLALGAAGCAHAPLNAPKESVRDSSGYYFATHVPEDANEGETLFLVAFSGGGTRAAAMAYGVLEELRRTPVPNAQPPRSLIEDINVISSVSGGSFTAAAYALFGESMFGPFETNFLKRDVQGKLVGKTLSPWNWPALWSPYFGRSDLAADYYDRILFHGATYADLQKGSGPFVMINATEVATGIQFWFTQDVWDGFCSDLGSYRISRAVAASSAVPVVLSPITLRSYAGTCGYEPPSWMQVPRSSSSGASSPGTRSIRANQNDLARLRDRENHPYLHFVDGGVADNLGLRPLIEGLALMSEAPESRRGLRFESLRRVVLLSVNARSSPENDWDKRESPPGMLALAVAAPSITMERYSRDTVDLMGALVRQFEASLGARGSGRLKFYPIVLGFDNLTDPEARRYFLNVPTSFFLSNEAVDRLRAVGGQLLRESPEYQALLQDYAEGRPPAG